MTNRLIKFLLLVVLISGFMASCALGAEVQSQEPITWTVSAFVPAGTAQYRIADMFCNAVNAASGGRLVLKLFAGGAIVPATKEIDGILDDILDAACTSFTYAMDKTSIGSILQSVVGEGMDAVDTSSWYLGGGGAELADKVFEKYNIKILHPPIMNNPEIWSRTGNRRYDYRRV